VLSDPFRRKRAWRNSTEIQQSDHAPRSGPEVKIGRSSAKGWHAGEAQMQDNPGGGESGTVEGVRRRCKKNSRSVLFCTDTRIREGCDRGSEVWTVHSR